MSSFHNFLSYNNNSRKCFTLVHRENVVVVTDHWYYVYPIYLHVYFGVGNFTKIIHMCAERLWSGPWLPNVWETMGWRDWKKPKENLKSGEPASGLRIDHRTSEQKARGANHWAACTQVKKLVEIYAPSTMAIFLLCVHSVGSHLWPYKLFLGWVLTIQQCWILYHWQSRNICTAGYF
jgi:hypothetical protein